MKDGIPTLIIYFVITSAAKPKSETSVVIKEGALTQANFYDTETRNFKELLKNNKIFLDNSLFIQDAFELRTSLYIIGPRKCGKTINLDMLKTFLEIQVDDQGDILPKYATSNYKLFAEGELITDDGTTEKLKTPLLISQHRAFIDMHLGEYPIIYLDFSDVTGNTLEEIEQSLGQVVRRGYRNHIYMIKALENIIRLDNRTASREKAERNLRIFQKILNTEERLDSLGDSIQDLHYILRYHFNKNPLFIYDDYDKPLTHILRLESFPENDLTELMQIMDHFIALSTRMDPYINRRHKVFIAGTFMTYRSPLAPWMNYTRLDLLLDSWQTITRYFGLHDYHIRYLFHQHELPADLSEKAYEWYKGYSKKQYNQYSIFSFLNSKRIAWYSKDEQVEDIVNCHLNTIQGRSTILSLLSNETVTTSLFGLQTRIRENVLKQLKPKLFNINARYDYSSNYTFAWYLIRKGYLHVRRKTKIKPTQQVSKGNEIRITIPNREIGTLMCSWLISYYQRQYKIPDQPLENASTSLLLFVNNETSSSKILLQKSLENLLQTSSFGLAQQNKNDTRYTKVEHPYRVLFTSVALKLQNSTDLEIRVSYPGGTVPIYVISDNSSDQIVIVQVSRNEEPVKDILKSLEQCVAQLQQKYTKSTFRVAAVKIWFDNTVQIHVKEYTKAILKKKS